MPTSRHRKIPAKRKTQPRRLCHGQVTDLHEPQRAAIIALFLERGDHEHCTTLLVGVLLAKSVAMLTHQIDLIGPLEAALKALEAIHARHQTYGGRWGAKEDEIAVLDLATEIERGLHSVTNDRVMRKAIAIVRKQIDADH
jgi:hypothetical protein